MPKFITQAINDEILQNLSLRKRYSFLNNNLMSILSSKEFSFLKEIQKFCMKFEKENDITHGLEEDIYDWVPEFGKKECICRLHDFNNIDLDYEPHGITADFMRCLATVLFDPQFAMVLGGTQLALNPINSHNENISIRLEALKELVTGKSTGCILITEPERGSDAIHLLSTCEAQEDGSYIINGEKIYNTNAPRSKWAVMYATAEKNNGNLLAQVLIDTSWDGWNCERIYIPFVPKVYLGKEKLDNLRAPKEFILGEIGRGREHLFEGLI